MSGDLRTAPRRTKKRTKSSWKYPALTQDLGRSRCQCRARADVLAMHGTSARQRVGRGKAAKAHSLLFWASSFVSRTAASVPKVLAAVFIYICPCRAASLHAHDAELQILLTPTGKNSTVLIKEVYCT